MLLKDAASDGAGPGIAADDLDHGEERGVEAAKQLGAALAEEMRGEHGVDAREDEQDEERVGDGQQRGRDGLARRTRSNQSQESEGSCAGEARGRGGVPSRDLP